MAKYLVDSSDIEIEEVSGTENIRFNFVSGNSLETKINNLSNYSTTEQVIGEWIDNKTLYRTAYNFGTLPDTDTKNLTVDFSNKNIKKIYGYAKATSTGTVISLPFATHTLDNIIALSIQQGSKITIQTWTDRTAFDECYIILEYTKTTD